MTNIKQLTDSELEDRIRQNFSKYEQDKELLAIDLAESWHRGSWKKAHSAFGKYVNAVLGISSQTAYRLIGTVDKSVGQYEKKMLNQASSVPNGTQSPTSEPKTQKVEFGMVDSKPEPQPTITVYKDREGRQIEGDMAEFFLEQDAKIKEWVAAIKSLKALILSDIECDPVWAGFNVSHFEKYIGNIKEMIKFNRPWAQCPVCSGDGGVKGGCKTCKDPAPVDPKAPAAKKGRGWLIHNQWRCIPDDEK